MCIAPLGPPRRIQQIRWSATIDVVFLFTDAEVLLILVGHKEYGLLL
jgi:hypothetical protein